MKGRLPAFSENLAPTCGNLDGHHVLNERRAIHLRRENSVFYRFPTGLALMGLLLTATSVSAQGPRPSDLGASKLALGAPGIKWYTTWETGLAEAKRSGRPIMFVAAATQCHGISGVF